MRHLLLSSVLLWPLVVMGQGRPDAGVEGPPITARILDDDANPPRALCVRAEVEGPWITTHPLCCWQQMTTMTNVGHVRQWRFLDCLPGSR